MKSVVRENWIKFSSPLEGRMNCMYADVLGLVTTGVGNLVDPISLALALPWERPEGGWARLAEIEAEWNRVKETPNPQGRGPGWWRQTAQLVLSEENIDGLVLSRLDQMDHFLLRRFPLWEMWPSAAQLGTLSMSWAMGPGFAYPTFSRAANLQDWKTCALECKISEVGNPGVIPRNEINKRLFEMAGGAGGVEWKGETL